MLNEERLRRLVRQGYLERSLTKATGYWVPARTEDTRAEIAVRHNDKIIIISGMFDNTAPRHANSIQYLSGEEYAYEYLPFDQVTLMYVRRLNRWKEIKKEFAFV